MGALRLLIDWGWDHEHRESRLYPLLLSAATVFVTGVSIGGNLFARARPAVGADAVVFQYSGWLTLNGAVMYRDLRDPKPPLIHELGAGLAVVGGGDPLVVHALSSILMGCSALAVVLLVYVLATDLTGNGYAGFVGAGALLTYPLFYLLPQGGLRPKMFVALFGLLGIYLYEREQFLASGASAFAAAGFWQLAVFFPVYVVYRAGRHSQRRLLHVVVGGVGVTAVAVLPFVLRGAVAPMLAQVVLAPFIASESLDLLNRLIVGGGALDFAIPVAVAGGVGTLASLRYEDAGWVLAGSVWFGLQVSLVDLDGGADIVPVFLFVAFGLALLADQADAGERRALAGTVLLTAVLMFWWHGGLSLFLDVQSALEPGSTEWLYWNEEVAQRCHVRRSKMELAFVERTGGSLAAETCSGLGISWPF